MRWRLSLWDLWMLAVLGASLWGSAFVSRHVTGPVPLHWGPTGTPDRVGTPGWPDLILQPLIGAAIYLTMRLLDGFMAARRPEFAGFLTRMGGGIGTALSALHGLILWAWVHPGSTIAAMPVIGLLFIYLGWVFRTSRDIPVNNAGLFPDTPEARAIVRRTLGAGFLLTGVLTTALGFLPGAWSLAALAPLILGPLGSVIAAVARALGGRRTG